METFTRSYSQYPAHEITNEQRKQLALKIISNEKPVSHIAEEEDVSRKFLYKQKTKAISAIDQAFEQKGQDDKVFFYIPVTKPWLCQVVLSLILNGRSSFRGVKKTFSDVFGTPISMGTIFNIIQDATSKASIINSNQDLRNVGPGANDELFHGNKPILTGVDIPSLYCYLLSEEEQRDADTWAIHYWYLVEQGFNPDYTVADFGSGLRDGQEIACSHIPCHGDIFHIIKILQDLKRYFANRLKSRISYLDDLETKMEKAKIKGNARNLSKKLGNARIEKEKFHELSKNINILVSWMQHDILKTEGPDPKTRRDLWDFIVDEMKKLESIYFHRIKSVRTTLENQRDTVLAFVDLLNRKFEFISQSYNVPLFLLWELCELQRYSQTGAAYYNKEKELRLILKHRFYYLQNAVIEAINNVHKASSSVENLHSRLRGYFSLKNIHGLRPQQKMKHLQI